MKNHYIDIVVPCSDYERRSELLSEMPSKVKPLVDRFQRITQVLAARIPKSILKDDFNGWNLKQDLELVEKLVCAK